MGCEITSKLVCSCSCLHLSYVPITPHKTINLTAQQITAEIERYKTTYQHDFSQQYSFPATNPITKKPIYFVTDPPHQLKRYRKQIISGKLCFVSLDNFKAISRAYPEVLPGSILDPYFQKQSVPLAFKLINPSVQQQAKDMGFTREEVLLKVLDNWINGVDSRGMKISQRLQYLNDMDKFLLGLLSTPFSMEDALARHISGMSQELFEEGLILNQCYRFVHEQLDSGIRIEFNSRVLSTDPVECFFSVLKTIYPKPTVRLALQAWRTISIEHRKQLDPARGYCRRVSLHASYYSHEISLSTWNIPEDKEISDLPPLVQKVLNKKKRKSTQKHGTQRKTGAVDPGWRSIRDKKYKQR